MSAAAPFLILNSDCDHATCWFANQMQDADLTLLRTFNSNDVHPDPGTDCLCPYHGTADCNCQILIFLVYQKGHVSPVTLIIHGYDHYTMFYLVDNPQQRADPGLEAAIRHALTPTPAHFFSQVSQMIE